MDKAIVYCTDGNDIPLLQRSIFSVRKYLGDSVDIYILADSLDADISGSTVLNVCPYAQEMGFHSFGWNRPWPYATLFRMFIPFIPELSSYKKILYLDTDTLILSEEAKTLFDTPDNGFEILAVKDSNGTYERVDQCVRNDLCQEAVAGILSKVWNGRNISDYTYVNAGVAIWCNENIRKNGLEWYAQRLKWFWEAETRCKFKYLDQDFINSMMITSCAFERRFNAFADMSVSEPIIKHYIKGNKNLMLKEADSLGYISPVIHSDPKIIVYASDGRDEEKLIQSAKSAKKNLCGDIRFFILTELPSYSKLPEATLINPTEVLKSVGFYSDGWNRKWPFSCLFRLAIPLVEEFSSVDKLLYLDTDTLIRTQDVELLFKLNSDGYEAYGVPDIEQRQWDIENMMRGELDGAACREMRKRLWDRRITKTHSYINSGILMLFLNQIRENGLDWYKQRLKWFWASIEHGRFKHPDQGFINLMMDVNPLLSIRFNKFGGDINTNCIIQHFVGGSKSSMASVARQMGL